MPETAEMEAPAEPTNAEVQKERDARVIYLEKREYLNGLEEAQRRIEKFKQEPAIEKWIESLKMEFSQLLHELPRQKKAEMPARAEEINRLERRIDELEHLDGTNQIRNYREQIEEFEETNGIFLSDLAGKQLHVVRALVLGDEAAPEPVTKKKAKARK